MVYTCSDYRLEMQLLALQRQLANERLNTDEKEALRDQIQDLEHRLGMGKNHPSE
jgi:hypothetical protein